MSTILDKMSEECGVFGVYGCQDAAKLCYLGLYALQHRGQEGAGIVTWDGEMLYVAKNEGLVSEVFRSENMDQLKGASGIGHVRYSTTGSNNINNIQPLYAKTSKGNFALAHNGNLTNASALYHEFKAEGSLFQSTVDSEVILHLMSRATESDLMEILKTSLSQIQGAFSLLLLGENCLVAARDPQGFRPLVLAKLGSGYVVASETCALDLIGAKYEREIEPGEIVIITDSGIQSDRFTPKTEHAFCIFEHVYFARPDSVVFGESVHLVRKEFGRILAQESAVEADFVMSIPDSGNSAALGYSEASGIRFEFGMTRNHYVGRTFIQPKQKIRDFGVKVKLNPVSSVLKGQRVVVVDDSLVRGTTAKQRVKALRDAGAKEVHLRISSPPIIKPCFFGIDTPNQAELIGSSHSVEQIRDYVGADTLAYLSLEGMLSAVKKYQPSEFCGACFTGKYPIPVSEGDKFSLETSKIKLYSTKR
jgi:amidophosphoribosyltransferase